MGPVSTIGLERRGHVDSDGCATHLLTEQDNRVTKKKHHYFYSKHPNFGMSTIVGQFMKYTHASMIKDVKNFAGVDPDAQFLIMDEYGVGSNVFTLEDFRRLTSGNASVFSGKIKGSKQSFEPRPDAQLLIFGNTHLFETLGKVDKKDGIRKISIQDAEMIKSRVNIHRLDAGGMADTEEEDRLRHTLCPDMDD